MTIVTYLFAIFFFFFFCLLGHPLPPASSPPYEQLPFIVLLCQPCVTIDLSGWWRGIVYVLPQRLPVNNTFPSPFPLV